MTRRLLPYEHELIEALGVSKEEYLEFIALQGVYSDPKEGTVADIRNWEVVAIVLTVVGVVFQVASALLAPRPSIPRFEAPEQAAGQGQSRDERFSPRFGFNSAQELATYGDPVNLVYANRGFGSGANPNGGVRVASSLLWSAVRSYGSSQFIQMLLMLSGGAVTAIDKDKTAFGQTPIRDIADNNTWTYFAPGGTGIVRRRNELDNRSDSDPTAYGTFSDNPYRIQPTTENTRVDGFSQAYSPTTSNTIGIYGVVPLNIFIYLRNSEGTKESATLGITAFDTNGTWTSNLSSYYTVNSIIRINFLQTQQQSFDTDIVREAKDSRRSLVGTFDKASVFKIGTALFRYFGSNDRIIDEGSVSISLQCIQAGYVPSTPYRATTLTSAVKSTYYTKAVVRIATAQYETVSACHIVDFALKATVFKRINGRQLQYGSNRQPGYPSSDNGIKPRVSLFKVKYKQTGQSTYVTLPVIFAISRAADNENFVYFRFNSNLSAPTDAVNWSFELEPISDPVAERDVNSRYFYLDNSGPAQSIQLTSYKLNTDVRVFPTIEFVGRVLGGGSQGLPPVNNNPDDINEWDLFNYDSDTQLQFSFDNGPEIVVTAVTEQLRQSFSDFNLYNNLALIGFNAYSGKTFQDLRSLSVFATQGRSVRRLRTSGTDEQGRPWGSSGFSYYPSNRDGASSLAPDIFLDTVLDKQDGIGNFAVPSGIDMQQLALSKRFCIRNNLFMDCVIASPRSWREFWVEVAPFSLLEFARIGGRETLVPAVPYDPNTGAITRNVNVSAIFNTGNILEDSYKEEYMDYGSNVQDLIATIIYTEVPADAVFAKKRSVDVQRRDTIEADAIRQTFDLSAYVSNLEQAVLFGKLICNTRRYVRQAIEFKTYPTSDPISPGAFIYVDIGQNSWDAIRTGVVAADGTLNVPLNNTPVTGTYNIQLYRSDRGLVTLTNVSIANGQSDSLRSYEGFLFVLGVEATTRRVFRVSEVQMDEEGETTVRASSYPCTSDGQSLLADFSDNVFTVRS